MSIYDNKIYRAAKRLLKSNPVTGGILKTLRRKRGEKKQLAKSVVFQSNVRKYFPEVINVFDNLGIDYFICFGTLLGAIREKDFIKHDDDLEMGVFSDQYDENLFRSFEKIGFVREYRYSMNGNYMPNEGFVEKYSNGVIHFDLFVFTRSRGNLWCWSYLRDESNTLNAIKLSWKDNGLERIPFQGLDVPVPVNAPTFLEALYGKTWNIPCVFWEDTMAGNIAETNKTDGRFCKF